MINCNFCNKELKKKKEWNSLSCTINKSNSGTITFTMRVRGSEASTKYRWGNLKYICDECAVKARRMLYNNDTILKEIANELEDLYCGKINNVMICKSLEEGNGK